jgi:hypothetical protein
MEKQSLKPCLSQRRRGPQRKRFVASEMKTVILHSSTLLRTGENTKSGEYGEYQALFRAFQISCFRDERLDFHSVFCLLSSCLWLTAIRPYPSRTSGS